MPAWLGFNLNSALLIALIAAVGGVWKAIINAKPAIQKINTDREANLLTERAEEMATMRAAIAKLEAERAVDRHRLNNVTQCLDALLLMIEMDPTKAQEAAAKVREMRARQLQAEAQEKGVMHAEAITRAENGGRP